MWGDVDVPADPADLPDTTFHASPSNEKASDYPVGYPHLTGIAFCYHCFSYGSRYGCQHRRLILDWQRELLELDEELELSDLEEKQRQGHDAYDEEDINVGERSRNDLGQRTRRHILDDIRKKLEEYDKILIVIRKDPPFYRSSSFKRINLLTMNSSESLHDYTHFQPDAFPRHRRGRRRGKRHTREDSVEEFFSTEMFVRDKLGGQQIPAIGRQDTLCSVPLICSSRWIREMNQESAVVRDVKCPGTTSISGHEVSFQGIVRNMVFTLKGLTFRRDVWVCDQLDGLYDFIFGASFIMENFKLLFQKVFQGAKNIFAGWFMKRKETPEEKKEAEALRAKQESEADILEKARQARQAEEREKRKQNSIYETNASSL